MLNTSTQTGRNVIRQNRASSPQVSTTRGDATQAFDDLQAAIVRLAVKQDMRVDGARRELRANVGRALEAYREYMKAVETQQ